MIFKGIMPYFSKVHFLIRLCYNTYTISEGTEKEGRKCFDAWKFWMVLAALLYQAQTKVDDLVIKPSVPL